ncbi:MAG TPA: CoA-binding protein [Candidatus Tectomicrobia bacterium]|nr:CoA-binding protein [Candidatus Tectomicrobia bacterium]
MDAHRLTRLLKPRSVAVVGAKKANDYRWLRCVSTFQGPVYSVNIDPHETAGIEALGVRNYQRLLDIPGAVDYVIVSVPREVTPIVLRDCIAKGVAGAMLFTSGFAETGTEKGRELEATITRLAREADLPLVGPNCMGIFNPQIGLRNFPELYSGESGPIGFLSQSGTHGYNFALMGYLNGIKVSKLISYGNAVILDSPDYLEYLRDDPDTSIIGMYIEGVRQGHRLFRLLQELTPRKPVVIWKGGQTEPGTRATASHTGSLAESMVIWRAVMRQTGAIEVDSLEEMVDTIKALLYVPPTRRDRVALISMTGGQSVVTTDAFAKAGLQVPTLTQRSYERLGRFFNIVGGSYRNPIDMGSNWEAGERTSEILAVLEDDPQVDIIAFELSLNMLFRRMETNPAFRTFLLDMLISHRRRTHKPFLAIVTPSYVPEAEEELKRLLLAEAIPSFPTFQRAAKALQGCIGYQRFVTAED